MAVDLSLDPLEQMIWDKFQNSTVLQPILGKSVYFEWNLSPQAMPYVCVEPMGGPQPIYDMPQFGRGIARNVITNKIRQFSLFSFDRQQSVDVLMPAISAAFEALTNEPLKNGDVCSSVLMRLDWQTRYDQDNRTVQQRNLWHSFCRFEFCIQRGVGVL